MPFGIGHPHLHIKCRLYVCSRVQGSQIFKQNSIISIHSKVIAFLMISLSPHGPCGPHIIPVIPIIPTSSPHHPHHPHVILRASMWSPWLRSPLSPPHVVPVVPTLSPSSPSSPHRPYCLHAVATSSPHHLKGFYIIPNPQRYPPHPTPPPGVGGPKSVKML